LNFKFPKSARLLSRFEYKTLYKKGTTWKGSSLIITYCLIGKNQAPKLGLTVSRRFGKAIERNRFKRAIREGFRLLYQKFPPTIALNVQPNIENQSITNRAAQVELKIFLSSLSS